MAVARAFDNAPMFTVTDGLPAIFAADAPYFHMRAEKGWFTRLDAQLSGLGTGLPRSDQGQGVWIANTQSRYIPSGICNIPAVFISL